MTEDATQYRALCRIDRDKKTYLTGSLIALPDETAARLLATDPPSIARVVPEAPVAAAAAPAAPAAANTSPAASPVGTRANAKTTIERVKVAPTIDALLVIQEEETSHADGPRATVLVAIDARLSALAAAEDGGSENGAGDDDEEDADGEADDEGASA